MKNPTVVIGGKEYPVVSMFFNSKGLLRDITYRNGHSVEMIFDDEADLNKILRLEQKNS
ncbi:hypothetical protein [Paraliobacillus ryukyuensis]|uniref:hypothetical protein n=1 Tax=Paraliobacillus ryukyuensis TaxID=200904 RepID=UPI001473C487|nr:hypothetical protein [Paraliobacillus ryukyuensis]